MLGKTHEAPWQGGFGTTLSWKGFSLSAQFTWVADRWMLNNDREMCIRDRVCADVNDVAYRKVLLDDDFQFSADKLLAATDEHTKLI